MITLTDVLTNKQWILPNSAGSPALYIGQYPPGRYDITNGSIATINVFVAPGKIAVIPAGKTWNIATQENDRSVYQYSLDTAVWQHSGRFN